ncbi:hypothetical protein [Anaeromyxobacter sp. PSR-1]|uniref:hypothetical protein n=1 Tax=Anaeromyxobacter sp. PSR-1 TaxID=1300915 RepID=UPI0005E92692|nr:hypothetical protein [Anaeromyxobacter sp. PSR-1]GAO03331.1 putative protein [Anaeromyxobacter sp. PSR-1]
MTRRRALPFRLLALGTALALLVPPAAASARRGDPRPELYPAVVQRVAGMVSDPGARRAAEAHGLNLVNVTWEDTGRWQGSSLGPNISDVTLEVVSEDGDARKLALMPVLRFPNFADRTADVPLDRIWLRVGNAREGGRERVITLRELLADPARWLSSPRDGAIRGGSLLAPRDTHALVSAQAAFLPVPRQGRATFHPVIFNYQSTAGDPAVLTILVTRQGTSLTVVDNARDTVSGGASWGQRLFFNAGGERAPLTAERLSDVRGRGTTMNGEDAAQLGDDANVLMLVQVPLRRREPPRRAQVYEQAPMAAAPAPQAKSMGAPAQDLETAVLGHGALDGPYTELAGLAVERDPRFPVRVTVQFYQATASGRIGDAEVARLAAQIRRVYEKGDYVGSLVVPGPGDARRPTAWTPAPPPPRCGGWEQDFPGLAERCRRYGTPRPAIGIR